MEAVDRTRVVGDWNGEIVRYDTQTDTVAVMAAAIPHPRGERLSVLDDTTPGMEDAWSPQAG